MTRTYFAFPKTGTLLAAAVFTSFFALSSAPVNAQNDGAADRVNNAGKLRMLSQRVAAASCNYGAGVAKVDSLAVLMSAQGQFNEIAHGLEFGNASLNINGAETRRKTVHAIHELHKEWDVLSDAVDNIANGTDVPGNVEFVAQKNMDVLERAKILVSEVSGQYSNPFEMSKSNALMLDFAGRQRMLLQKISKESCLVWTGHPEASDDLKGTMQIFEATLEALQSGNTNVGIKKAPTAAIAEGLATIREEWLHLKPSLEAAAANTTVDDAQRAEVFSLLNTLLVQMNDVTGLYAEYGKYGA